MDIEANNFFEKYLIDMRIPYQHFDDMDDIKGKRPDFLVSNSIYVEVKEIGLEDWEANQLSIQQKLDRAFEGIELGYGFSSYASFPTDKEIKFFAKFVNGLKRNPILSLDIPVHIVMPKYNNCKPTEVGVSILFLLDDKKQRKQAIVYPETLDLRCPVNWIDLRWMKFAEKQGKIMKRLDALSYNPVIVLSKNGLGYSRILPICICGSFGKSSQIKGKIKKASGNLEPYKDKGPCVLILYSKSFAGITKHELLNAIGGTEQITFPVFLDGKQVNDQDIKLVRKKDGQLTPWKNTRFSAISVMTFVNDGMGLKTYHNPFASIALPKETFLGRNDKVYYFDSYGMMQEFIG